MTTDSDNNEEQPQCGPFTLLHTRRFASKSVMTRLCPSMDLLFVLSSSSASALTLYRSVTFQKLVTLTTATTKETATAAQHILNETTTSGFTHAAWRPDGKWLACADDQGNVILHELESILASSSSDVVVVTAMNRNNDLTSSSRQQQQQLFMSLALPVSSNVRALLWNHMARPHPLWKNESNHAQTNESPCWELDPSPLANNESLFLPYQNQLLKRKSNSMILNTPTSSLLTDQTPLSILMVISEQQQEDTNRFHLHICLHGCYPILTNIHIPIIPTQHQQQTIHDSDNTTTQRDAIVVTSTNLTQVAVCVPSYRQYAMISLYSIPSMQQHRYALQTISTLYASTTSRLHQLNEAIPDILGSWRSSLKPLDMKVQGLVRLLENYGLLEPSTRQQLLVQYVLSGHTRAAPNLSNAMDQFFTGVQMNDQLIQRLEQSLMVSVANVESQCREHLLEPAQACVYQFSRLHGLARQVEGDPFLENDNDDDDAIMLLSSKHSLRCLQCAEIVLLTVENTLVQLMEARFRLKDWMAWLRAVGAQIKARGTAPQSARHENARKRRVPDAVVKRMLRYLSESSNSESNDHKSSSCGMTESILHLKFAHLLEDDLSETPAAATRTTLPQCFGAIQTAATHLFARPPQCVAQQMQTTQLLLDNGPSLSHAMAMIIRMGRGDAVVECDGFYCPSPTALCFRQWLVVAQPCKDKGCLDLHAIPLSWNGRNSLASPHTWTARLQLDHCDEILALEFYSDDGKSTLSGESNGKEGSCQALAVLMRVGEGVVLSLVAYDELELSMHDLKGNESLWSLPQPICTIKVQPIGSNQDDGIVYAKSRIVTSCCPGQDVSLVLSGSRGMAAVECSQEVQGVVLELFDLEEDEEEVEEDDDEDAHF